MPPDSSGTKRRILEAARAEFALHGLSGARVERIANTARANKQSIYAHFGAKEELFDLVVAQALLELADMTPFDVTAIPAYAGELFDRLAAFPDVLRLTTWAVLERPQPIDAEVESYRTKVEAIVAAQEEGLISRDHDAVELLAMVISLVASWSGSSWSLRSLSGHEDLDTPPPAFRAQMIKAVERVLAR